jgi:hypothetical protein
MYSEPNYSSTRLIRINAAILWVGEEACTELVHDLKAFLSNFTVTNVKTHDKETNPLVTQVNLLIASARATHEQKPRFTRRLASGVVAVASLAASLLGIGSQ